LRELIMSERFDPYHRWLGIPPEDQPPHHYRLLGIAEFESDREVIDSVAMRHISFLQDVTDGPHLQEAQRLLNELAAARRCLLDPEKKAAYDAQLRERLAERFPAPPPVVPPAESSRSGSEKHPSSPPVINSPPIRMPGVSDRQDEPRQPLAGVDVHSASQPARSARGKRDSQTPRGPNRRVVIIAASAAAIVMLLSVTVWFSRSGGNAGDREPANMSQAEPSSAADPDDPVGTGVPWEDEVVQEDHLAPATEPGDEPAATSLPPPPSTDTAVGTLPSVVAPRELTPPAPQKIDGLLLWLDASDQATLRCDDSSGILSWVDKSGGGYQAEADDAGSRPRLIDDALGEKSVVQFDEASYLSLPGTSTPFDLGTEYTVIHVARGARGCLLSKGSGDSPGSFAWAEGTAGLQIGGKRLSAAGDTGEAPRVRVAVASREELRWFIDGNANRSDSDTDHAIKTNSVLRLGCVWKRGSGAEQFFQGQLAELLIYNRALDDAERIYLEDYLAEKWLRGQDAPEALVVDPTDAADADDAMVDNATEPAISEGDASTEPNPATADGEAAEDQQRRGFVVLMPSRLEASGDSRLQVLDGGIVLADGATRENERYRIAVEMPPGPMTALRLEALPHESLPATGPGWGLAGRFALSELQASIESADGAQPAREIGWTVVVDDRDDAAKRLVDGMEDNSWTVRRRGETVRITLLPTTPVETAAGDRLNITLLQRENLGCFRLLATSDVDPLASAADGPSEATGDGEDDDRFVLFVNLGGDSYEDDDGNTWQKSHEFDGQGFGHENGNSAGKGETPYPRQAWAETAIRGLTAFRAAVPAEGTYEVTLCFCEQWTRDADRRRFYAVLERGTPQATTLPFRGPGIGRPWTHTVPKVLVKDGTLDIDFSPLDNQSSAILNAIVIRQATQNPRPPRGR